MTANPIGENDVARWVIDQFEDATHSFEIERDNQTYTVTRIETPAGDRLEVKDGDGNEVGCYKVNLEVRRVNCPPVMVEEVAPIVDVIKEVAPQWRDGTWGPNPGPGGVTNFTDLDYTNTPIAGDTVLDNNGNEWEMTKEISTSSPHEVSMKRLSDGHCVSRKLPWDKPVKFKRGESGAALEVLHASGLTVGEINPRTGPELVWLIGNTGRGRR